MIINYNGKSFTAGYLTAFVSALIVAPVKVPIFIGYARIPREGTATQTATSSPTSTASTSAPAPSSS
jgi:hypothetical protein